MTVRVRPADSRDADAIATVIRIAFRDVAVKFGITVQNAPTHPSNASEKWILDDMEKGIEYVVAEVDGAAVGCVAYHKVSTEVVEAQRLAVTPQYREYQLSKLLNQKVLNAAREYGAKKVRISIVADHRALRRWYERMGFMAREVREFEHLPFKIQYLENCL